MFYKLIAAACLFGAFFFSSVEATDTTNFLASINDARLGYTATQVKFTFTLGATVNKDDTNKAVIITADTQIFAADGNMNGNTDDTSKAKCVATAGTSVVSLTNDCVVSGPRTVLTCTPDTSSGFILGKNTITCTGNLAQNAGAFAEIKFGVQSNDDQLAGGSQKGWAVGSPRVYYLRSECRTGGFAGGLLDTGSGNPIKTCSSGKSFVVVSGLQNHAGDEGSCANGEKDKNRCDALYHTDSSVDIAVSTMGSLGTLECGAVTKGSAAPTLSLNNIIDIDSTVISANSVFVSDADRDKDHVVTLFGLTNDLQYDIYCHMDELYMSPVLTVWTDLNDRLWGDSLVPSEYTRNLSPSTITLTFKHGVALAADDSIILTPVVNDNVNALFSAGPDCKATTNGNTLALKGTAGTGAQTGYNTQALSGTGNKILTITIDGPSAKGAEVIVVCNSGLNSNLNSVYTTSYKLEATGNQALQKRFGWKTV